MDDWIIFSQFAIVKKNCGVDKYDLDFENCGHTQNVYIVLRVVTYDKTIIKSWVTTIFVCMCVCICVYEYGEVEMVYFFIAKKDNVSNIKYMIT